MENLSCSSALNCAQQIDKDTLEQPNFRKFPCKLHNNSIILIYVVLLKLFDR